MTTKTTPVISAVVDRVEGRVAILEVHATTIELDVGDLPAGLVEGSWLVIEPERWKVRVDTEATQAARDAIARLQRRAARDDDGGDIEL